MLLIVIILSALVICFLVLVIVLIIRSHRGTSEPQIIYSAQKEKNILVNRAGAEVDSGQLGSGSLFNGYGLQHEDTVCISGKLASGRLPQKSSRLILTDVNSMQNLEKEFYIGVIIGRNPYVAVKDGETGLVIAGTGISSVHCRIFADRNNYYVEDKNSTNGTFLNGQRICSMQEIKTGDRLKIGKREFYVKL